MSTVLRTVSSWVVRCYSSVCAGDRATGRIVVGIVFVEASILGPGDCEKTDNMCVWGVASGTGYGSLPSLPF